MERVYVLEPGSYLRKSGDGLKVLKKGELVEMIPASGLKRLMLVGHVSLSGGMLDFLIKNRVETVFVTPGGRFRARLMLDEHRHVELRKAQYRKLGDPGFALELSRKIVGAKLKNMYRLVLRRARQLEDEELRLNSIKLKSLIFLLPGFRSIDQVRGIEGIASRTYYAAFKYLIRNKEFRFGGRNRRPPKDPVNALLSFVYTLLTNEVLSAINQAGLDPYLGALHEIAYGRPSLACDLVEEYRAFLGDRLVLGLLNRKMISPGDFIYRKNAPKDYIDEKEMAAKRPVEMKPSVRKVFISAYEEMMNRMLYYEPDGKKVSYRWLIRRQVARFSDSLKKDGVCYEPFVWKR